MRFVPPTPPEGFRRSKAANDTALISKGFWLGETPVTKGLFESVYAVGHENRFALAVDGEAGTPGNLPAESLSWYAAIAFCIRLSLREGRKPAYSVTRLGVQMQPVHWEKQSYSIISQTGLGDWDVALDQEADGYRLPTEMEWLWAAIGATEGGPDAAREGYKRRCSGSASAASKNDVKRFAWIADQGAGGAAGKTHGVGLKIPNELGLYDMSGNVWEWCWDGYADLPSGRLVDYGGSVEGSKVARGGSWNGGMDDCSMSSRFKLIASASGGAVGLRLARNA